MKKVTIYTTDYCGYCSAAKKLLQQHQIAFEEIDVSNDDEKRRWLVERTGQRTVPQIFFGDDPIGGFSDLSDIVRKGELQERLVNYL